MKTLIILRVVLLIGLISVWPVGLLAQEIEFHVYDSGRLLNWDAFRRIQENGHGEKGDNDKLLDPDDLTTIIAGNKAFGFYSSNRQPILDWPGDRSRVTLSLAWPSKAGYSNLMLDLPRPDLRTPVLYADSRLPVYSLQGERPVVIFNLLAAQQVVDDLDRSLTRRTQPPFSFPYVPSTDYRAAYITAYNTAKENLLSAKADGLSEAQRAVLGEKAFQAASTATLLMLEDYGVQYAMAKRSQFRPKWGVTFEIQQQPLRESTFDSVAELVNCDANDGWVRLIISRDRDFKIEDYQQAIKWAHSRKLKVLAELLDSEDMCSVTEDQWQVHVKKYVDVLSSNESDPEKEVDQWEVGNEVNGEWLVEKADGKPCTGYAATADFIAFAAQYVKTSTDKPTLLTLYWQVGEAEPSSAMFDWLNQRLLSTKSPDGKSVLTYLDDIGLSLYPDKHPMGTAFDRVMFTLRAKYFTHHRLMISELDYWPPRNAEPDYGHVWRWGEHELLPTSSVAEFQRARANVARLYQSAILGFPYSDGGSFWWYYLQEADPNGPYSNNEIWKALHAVHTRVAGRAARCEPRR